MALQGTLKDFSLADIFQLIGIQKKTGVLSLKSPQETVTVTFVEGQVVGADSTLRRLEDRLGFVLAKSGRLTDAQLQEALRVQRSTLKRLGTILVEGHLIDPKALSEALQIQISQMVYRLFRWTAGEYHFSQDAKVEYDRELVAPMSAESILMEGARILDEWPMIEKGIGSFQSVYKHANVEIARPGVAASARAAEGEAAGAITLSDSERQIYSLVNGQRPVQEIVERSPLSEFDTCRTLYELISRHLLDEVRRTATPGQPARRVESSSPILLGLVYLIVVLLAGSGLLVRVLPWLGRAQIGSGMSGWLTPFLTPETRAALDSAVVRSRLQRVSVALETYYLLNRGYPAGLEDLVTDGLIRPDSLFDAAGRHLLYQPTKDGYRLGQGQGSSD
ncbi:MAG TPA: DUF4388 domain-containing protein [Patescibacteria group bacterium]|nr:DUF4388 domain-containing protein [Patescibacteria group bacterium]